MKTAWARDVSEVDRARVDVDPWQVRLQTGYHPLYDYETNATVAHAEWRDSSLRREVITALGDEIASEVDATVANARTLPSLEQRRLADAALAAAWRTIPLELLSAQPVHGPRRRYGSTFDVGGLRVTWAAGASTTDPWAHVATFPRGPLRLGTVTFAAHSPAWFVFALEQTLPLVVSVDGQRVEAFDLQAPSLGMTPGAFSTVFVSSVAMVNEQFFLRCHSQAHVRGEAFAVTSGNWWSRLDPERGIVARAQHVGHSSEEPGS